MIRIILSCLILSFSLSAEVITAKDSKTLREQKIDKINIVELDKETLKKLLQEDNVTTEKRFFAVQVFRGGKLPSNRLLWFELNIHFKGGITKSSKVSLYSMATQSEVDIVSVSFPFAKSPLEIESYSFSGFVYK